jgi:hypothetical protein
LRSAHRHAPLFIQTARKVKALCGHFLKKTSYSLKWCNFASETGIFATNMFQNGILSALLAKNNFQIHQTASINASFTGGSIVRSGGV